MKSILLIGLGRFGRHIAMKLDELHHQVMAVDTDEKRVEAVLPYVTNAQIGDATDEEFLSSLGVRNFDVCIVAIGDNFQSSLETTSLLKELTRWCIQKNSWLPGPPSVTAQTTFLIMWSWMRSMRSLRWQSRRAGRKRPSASST